MRTLRTHSKNLITLPYKSQKGKVVKPSPEARRIARRMQDLSVAWDGLEKFSLEQLAEIAQREIDYDAKEKTQ